MEDEIKLKEAAIVLAGFLARGRAPSGGPL